MEECKILLRPGYEYDPKNFKCIFKPVLKTFHIQSLYGTVLDLGSNSLMFSILASKTSNPVPKCSVQKVSSI